MPAIAIVAPNTSITREDTADNAVALILHQNILPIIEGSPGDLQFGDISSVITPSNATTIINKPDNTGPLWTIDTAITSQSTGESEALSDIYDSSNTHKLSFSARLTYDQSSGSIDSSVSLPGGTGYNEHTSIGAGEIYSTLTGADGHTIDQYKSSIGGGFDREAETYLHQSASGQMRVLDCAYTINTDSIDLNCHLK